MDKRIHIGGLPPHTTEAIVQRLCNYYLPEERITSCQVVNNSKSYYKFAFVTFLTVEGAKKAVKQMHDQEYYDVKD